jgi:hypothetical protein
VDLSIQVGFVLTEKDAFGSVTGAEALLTAFVGCLWHSMKLDSGTERGFEESQR